VIPSGSVLPQTAPTTTISTTGDDDDDLDDGRRHQAPHRHNYTHTPTHDTRGEGVPLAVLLLCIVIHCEYFDPRGHGSVLVVFSTACSSLTDFPQFTPTFLKHQPERDGMDTTHCDSPPDDDYMVSQQREPLDYSPSSGAVGAHEKTYDGTAPRSHDGRAETETSFHPTYSSTPFPRTRGDTDGEAVDTRFDTERERWQWLRKLNDGLREDGDGGRVKIHRERAVSVACSAFNATEYQEQRINHLLESVQEERETGLFFGRDRPVEVVILGAVTIVLNEDGRPLQHTFLREDSDGGGDGGVGTDMVAFDEFAETFTPVGVTQPVREIKTVRSTLAEYT
jgi:hypothetical protein